MRCLLFVFTVLVFSACQEVIDAPVPNLAWTEFDATGAIPLGAADRNALEGVYTVGDAKDDFGEEAALKWSYVINSRDTVYYLSFFCAEDVRYFICQGRRSGDKILLNGYWRNVENTKTGRAHFTVQPAANNAVSVNGVYGMFNDEPEKKVSFRYARPLNRSRPYLLVAHRGGGRNNDLLPASENSVEMIPLAAQFGANGIEIDVQLTKDGVPIIYHDDRINDRLTHEAGIHGKLEEYTFAELQKDITLKRGGKIPTLEQALETVLTKTPLEFVWLDCKYPTVLQKVRALQQAYTEKAKSAGRKLEIVIGIPDEEVMKGFTQLPGYRDVPSLCELDTAKVEQVHASIWAPSWTKGHQDEEVAAMQAAGRRALTWTVDVPDKIKEFMYEARFNGLVTNRPTMAAYYLFARK